MLSAHHESGFSFSAREPAKSAPRPGVLRRGATGLWVVRLQRALLFRGYLSLEALATGPGIFGPRTEQAVKALQVDVGLPETGMVGSRTWVALTSDRHDFAPAQRAIPSSNEASATLD